MKILFLCTSLEPGRDGVGDYVRLLAGQCAVDGHACAAVALNDRYVADEINAEDSGLKIFRLSAAAPWPQRLGRAAAYIRGFAPDWVSWQFVAYGFDRRGLIPSELERFATELRGFRCHVMMHELWIGLEHGATWRSRYVGWTQRRRILRLLDRLWPDVLQTSNVSYQQALARAGYGAEVLGLFGNVPVGTPAPVHAVDLTRWLPASGSEAKPGRLIALTFGTLHPQWQPARAAAWLHATARRRGRRPALLIVGRAGAGAPAVVEVFRNHGIEVGVTGDVAAGIISDLMAAANFGIAAHPWALIAKSGAAAAMLDHGLPVLVPRDDWEMRGTSPQPGLVGNPLLARLSRLSPEATDSWLDQPRQPQPALPRITAEFLGALEGSTRPSGSLQAKVPRIGPKALV